MRQVGRCSRPVPGFHAGAEQRKMRAAPHGAWPADTTPPPSTARRTPLVPRATAPRASIDQHRSLSCGCQLSIRFLHGLVGYDVLLMSTPDEPSDISAAADRLRRIESVTEASLAYLDVEDLLHELLERVQGLLEVDTAAVLLLDPSTDQLVATAARGIEAEVHQGVRIPVGKGFAGRIAAEKKPVILEHVDHTNVLNPVLRERGIRSLLGVPLLSGGNAIGVMHVGTLGARQFTDDDVRLLQIVADRVAFATESRRAEVERTAATVLQRSLLPRRLPVVPGCEMAARYIPAEHGGVGGDWYDVFTLPSGELCVVIGDVVGRGLSAAAMMGRLRSALRAHALHGSDPAEVLDSLDQHVQHFAHEAMATVQVGMFEPSFERMHLSSAGHPPPVLVVPDQPATLVDMPSDLPVGVRGGVRRRVSIDVPPGALLCFYTDGLVERRDTSLDVGLKRLCEAVVAGPAESVCASVMGRLIGDEPPGDDVAVLVLRRQDSGKVGPMDLAVPAQPWALKRIRFEMRRWLLAFDAPPRVVADLLVAVGEACSNVVEHAYGPEGGIVTVYMELQLPDVVATVGDTGRWRLPRTKNRRRGTLFMRECADNLRIEHGSNGTKVVVRRRLDQWPSR
jgi:anti-sigma regulatory factor (Ser/Thr protein kinase)/putative methionine-R-sulfoxide reductase with GAF domain